jgi:hypothetical protein
VLFSSGHSILLIYIVLSHARIKRDSIGDRSIEAIAAAATDGECYDDENDDQYHDSN